MRGGAILAHIGRDPNVAGIANIGGILSLVVLILGVIRAAYRRRSDVLAPMKQRRHLRIRRVRRDFRLARRLKRVGLSDMTIIGRDIFKTAVTLAQILMSLCVVVVNVSSANASMTNLAFVVLFFVVVIVQAITFVNEAEYAVDKIQYANWPDGYRENVARQLRRASRRLI